MSEQIENTENTTEETAELVNTDMLNPNTGLNYTAEEVEAHNLAAMGAAGSAPAAAKRPKKLAKLIDGTKVSITVADGEKGEMIFDTAELAPEIQAKLVPFGAGHKLGDAAAGRSGKDAEEAIEKVWEGLVKGDWSVRAPAAPKVSLSDIKTSLANMSPEEAEAARKLLASMGIQA